MGHPYMKISCNVQQCSGNIKSISRSQFIVIWCVNILNVGLVIKKTCVLWQQDINVKVEVKENNNL